MNTTTQVIWSDEWREAPHDKPVVVAMRDESGDRWLAMGWVGEDGEDGEVWFAAEDGSEYLVRTTTGDPVSTERGGEWPEAWCLPAFPGE